MHACSHRSLKVLISLWYLNYDLKKLEYCKSTLNWGDETENIFFSCMDMYIDPNIQSHCHLFTKYILDLLAIKGQTL